MTVIVAVTLGIGILFAAAVVRRFTSGKAITARQIAGLWLAGLILLLIGRASPGLAKGLTLLLVLSSVLTAGFTNGLKIAALEPKSTTKATPAPTVVRA